MEIKPKDIPTEIKVIRVSLGLNQKDFAKEIGATKLMVSKWERGLSKISAETMDRLREMVR